MKWHSDSYVIPSEPHTGNLYGGQMVIGQKHDASDVDESIVQSMPCCWQDNLVHGSCGSPKRKTGQRMSAGSKSFCGERERIQLAKTDTKTNSLIHPSTIEPSTTGYQWTDGCFNFS